MTNLMNIDCAVLSHENRNFIFPTISLAQIISLNNVLLTALHTDSAGSIQRMPWKTHSIPLVTFDLAPFVVKHERHEKIAVVNAFFSAECRHPPFFAVYFTGSSYRIRVSEKTIHWTDEEDLQAEVDDKGTRINVTVLDLFLFSKRIEQRLSEISKKSL